MAPAENRLLPEIVETGEVIQLLLAGDDGKCSVDGKVASTVADNQLHTRHTERGTSTGFLEKPLVRIGDDNDTTEASSTDCIYVCRQSFL